jgi:DNA processing protein
LQRYPKQHTPGVVSTEDDFDAWFRLLQTPGIGREAARRLLAACGTPAAVFAAGPGVWRELVSPAIAQALGSTPPEFSARLAAARHWLTAAPGRLVLTLGDPAYPDQLLQTADPPLLMYLQGPEHLSRSALLAGLAVPSLALVGSRQATPQGRDNARNFAAALVQQGLAVVSGLAQGIDAAAHEGALQVLEASGEAGGETPASVASVASVASAASVASSPSEPTTPSIRAWPCTIAVVGTGLDRVYPRQHLALARRIATQGLLLSEYAPGTPALPEHFPQRNRIIAGLSLGTLVVEAAPRSGSLITARLASEAGREVFAIPGSIHAPQAQGCHGLIKQGAKLVETVADIVDELRDDWRQPGAAVPRRGRTPSPSQRVLPMAAAADTDPLLLALGDDPVTLDALLARTGEPTQVLLARLMELELDGHVARLPGGLYQRRRTG